MSVVGVGCEDLISGDIFQPGGRKRRCGLCHSCTSAPACGTCRGYRAGRRCQARQCTAPLEVFRLREGGRLDMLPGEGEEVVVDVVVEEEKVEEELVTGDVMVGLGEEEEEEFEVFTVEVKDEYEGGGYNVSMEEGQCILMHEDVLQP